MLKEKMRLLRDMIVKHGKIAFPVIVIVAVAVTVAFALGADKVEERMEEVTEEASAPEEMQDETVLEIPEVELTENTDSAVYSLIATYYNAFATGDVETIRNISNYLSDVESVTMEAQSKYIESYPLIKIYTKPGPAEQSLVAYVYTQVTFYGHEELIPGIEAFYICADENGVLYLNRGELSEQEVEYIQTVSLQDDVVELYNKVSVEYNDLMVNNENLYEYLSELENEVNKDTGEILASQVTEEGSESSVQEEEGTGQEGSEAGEAEQSQEPAVSTELYATAATTVNVRSSDSAQSDKLGKLVGGTRIQVKEQLANGWSRIVFEGSDGYVKTEYLRMEETASAGGQAIKTQKATTNVNMRKEPSENAEKIGIVVGGDSLEVLSEAEGWSQVRYKNVTGYVKTEYLQ